MEEVSTYLAPLRHNTSAFSPSANANEDWTKISDLAERRRIQNRIAQRNYRKKLKKRLEDLERRAGSSSASPEQKHEELDLDSIQTPSTSPSCYTPSSDVNVVKTREKQSTRKKSSTTSYHPSDDKSMFSRQHMRQLSTSPPPFQQHPSYSYDMPATPQYSHVPTPLPYAASNTQTYSTYLSPIEQRYPNQWQQRPSPIKQDHYGEDEMSPFSMSYANMAGIVDIPYAGGYHEQPAMIHTPELSDTYEHSSAGSPGEFNDYSLSLLAMPLTPPLQPYEK